MESPTLPDSGQVSLIDSPTEGKSSTPNEAIRSKPRPSPSMESFGDSLIGDEEDGSEIYDDDPANYDSLQAPIVGFEVMEQRAKFTVFKIRVRKTRFNSWFVFRRYTDFVRLNEKLKLLFPIFRLSLPPKRWFGSSFEAEFIEERQLGLQAFLNNVISHKDIVNSIPVREFLCLDDPPGAHDSLEESRALCESLEEALYNMKSDLNESRSRISLLEEENSILKSEIANLTKNSRPDPLKNSIRRLSAQTVESLSEKDNSSKNNLLSVASSASSSILGSDDDLHVKMKKVTLKKES